MIKYAAEAKVEKIESNNRVVDSQLPLPWYTCLLDWQATLGVKSSYADLNDAVVCLWIRSNSDPYCIEDCSDDSDRFGLWRLLYGRSKSPLEPSYWVLPLKPHVEGGDIRGSADPGVCCSESFLYGRGTLGGTTGWMLTLRGLAGDVSIAVLMPRPWPVGASLAIAISSSAPYLLSPVESPMCSSIVIVEGTLA